MGWCGPGVGRQAVAMDADVKLTFGAGLSGATGLVDVRSAAVAAEAAGFDVLTAPDHLGYPAPFSSLAVAAAVTERIRLRTYVLDAYFWNPALLAREVATLDALSGGRFELGLGAGHMKHEHDDAGLPFPPVAERVAELERVLVDVRRRLADPDHRPAPVQARVPVSIGAWGAASMDVAVRQAEVISLSGALQVKGARAGVLRLSDGPDVEQRLEDLRASIARDRPAELPPPVLDCLLQRVVVDADPAEAAAAMAAEAGGRVSAEELLRTPFVLFAASPQEAAAELRHRRERWGLTSWITHAPFVPALGRVIAALA